MKHCLGIILKEIKQTCPILDEGYVKKQALRLSKRNSEEDDANHEVEETNNKDTNENEFWASYKLAARIHIEVHEVFECLINQPEAWQLLSENGMDSIQSNIIFTSAMYCSLLHRYFSDINKLNMARKDLFGFVPAQGSEQLILSSSSKLELEDSIQSILKDLYPNSDFINKRKITCSQLERSLISNGCLPAGTTIAIYGSSLNNFGSEGADMDMCLLFPDSFDIEPDQKPAFIEKIGDSLLKLGMTDVKTRPTARIPIVQFKDLLNS